MTSGTDVAPANVSLALRVHARAAPERTAIATARGERASFAELERRIDAIARGLAARGVARGDRVSLFVRPGVELIAVTHALFRLGAVPVLIDPGMGRRSLLACVERMAPRALIAVPRAHVARALFPRAFRSVDLAVTVGRRPLRVLGAPLTLAAVERTGDEPFPLASTGPDDLAAILFTSGSTGPPKGVEYTHGNFLAQLAALRALYDLRAGEVDVACFPLFALFDNALGMTSVFPELDPSRPAACDPAKVFAAIEEHRATTTFGSPAIWRRVLPWMEREGRRFATLTRLTIAGAPVPPALCERLAALLPAGGEVHTPYGATESLPVASISSAELPRVRRAVERGAGTCVGRLAPGVACAVIPVTDDPVGPEALERSLPAGTVGEICVQSAQTTRAYAGEPAATRLAKIAASHDGEGDAEGGTVWHRMGDLGYLDADGRLWFCGRKAHRIETAAGPLYPVPVENAFLGLPGVHRTALVGVGVRGAERPVLVVELDPEQEAPRRDALAAVARRRAELEREGGLLAATPLAAVLVHRGFPVDVRHNAKIHRLALKRWAEGRLA
jgi:acyl-CoA synthetase (AMP-forming)/AMP-acid ligase II